MLLLWVALYYIAWNVVILSVIATDTCNTLKNSGNINASSVVSDLLTTAVQLLNDAKKYACAQPSYLDSDIMMIKPMDCAEIKMKNSISKSGVYEIWPRSRVSRGSIKVFCDMEDDGGGWTVIQRRGDFGSPTDYFYQGWKAYKFGFGDPMEDFWLGNDNIFALTNERANQIKFTLADWEGNKTYAIFDEFWIDDEYHKYTAHVNGYKGTAGDSFSVVNGVPFSTKDEDNDTNEDSCAVSLKGSWWYTFCHASSLNGLYLKGAHESHGDGVEWYEFRGHYYSLKDTVMKVRSVDYQKPEEVKTDVTPQ